MGRHLFSLSFRKPNLTDANPNILHTVRADWFGGVEEDAALLGDCRKRWFQSGQSRDEEIRQQFAELPEQFQGMAPGAFSEAGMLLGAVLVLDQFPRHLFRGMGRAFAYDASARQLTHHALAQGWERKLREIEGLFLLMPLQHSETLEEQKLSVQAANELLMRSRPGYREMLEQSVESAEKHRDIIVQFGRFPHRNQALERKSTEAETEWLKAGGMRFGQ